MTHTQIFPKQIKNFFPADGRLTLTSAVPVTTGDVTAAGAIYYTPYKGNKIALYNGSWWDLYEFSERSFTLASPATNANFDVFIYDNAGVLTLELTTWNTNTARITALDVVDGVLLKNGARTHRYLGTIRVGSVAQQAEDSRVKRFVWNYYNRVKRPLHYTIPTGSWTYATATWRQANGSAAAQVEVVTGYNEDEISLKLVTSIQADSSTIWGAAAIGEDSTTAPHADSHYQGGGGVATNGWFQAVSTLDAYPAAIGYHYYTWLEYATGATITFVGGTGANYYRAGLNGSFFC